MITLRRKALVLVSAVMVTLALIVLPGCKKDSGTPTKTGTTPGKKVPSTGME